MVIKVPLVDLAQSKEKVRSALNHGSRQAGRKVITATGANFLYPWNENQPEVEDRHVRLVSRQEQDNWNPVHCGYCRSIITICSGLYLCRA